MNTIKKYIPYFPHALLVIFTFTCLIRGASTAEAVIIIALAGLSAYRIFLSHQEQPDYSKQFSEEMADLKKEITILKTEMGQISFNTRRVGNEKVRF